MVHAGTNVSPDAEPLIQSGKNSPAQYKASQQSPESAKFSPPYFTYLPSHRTPDTRDQTPNQSRKHTKLTMDSLLANPHPRLPQRQKFFEACLICPDRQTASLNGFNPDLHSECSICFLTSEIPLCPLPESQEQGHEACKIASCGHWFGSSCLRAWLENNNTCPMCRKELSWIPKTKDDHIRAVHQELLETLDLLTAQYDKEPTPFIHSACNILRMLIANMRISLRGGPPPIQAWFFYEDLAHVRRIGRNIGDLFDAYGPHTRSDPARDRAAWAWSDSPCHGDITDAWVMATFGHVERMASYLLWFT